MAITEAEQFLRGMFSRGPSAHETARDYGAQALASMDLAGKGLELFTQVYNDPMAGFSDALKLVGTLVGGPAGAAIGGLAGEALAPSKGAQDKERGRATKALFGDATEAAIAGPQSPGAQGPQVDMQPLTSPATYALPTPSALMEDPYEQALEGMLRLQSRGQPYFTR